MVGRIFYISSDNFLVSFSLLGSLSFLGFLLVFVTVFRLVYCVLFVLIGFPTKDVGRGTEEEGNRV